MITQARLKQYLSYDPETGIFIRKEPTKGTRVGSVIGSKRSKKDNDYIATSIDGEKCYLHRLAFLYMTGSFPKNNVDHINGDKTDNRFANLREATVSQNGMNRPKQSNNKSGYKGVCWEASRNKWKAQIKSRFIGYYDTAEEAFKSYTKEAERIFGEYNHNQ